MPTALIIGGTGQIGQAAAADWCTRGWRVRVLHRGTHWPAALRALEVEPVPGDRDAPGVLARALGGGADLVLDCVAYTAAHGRQLAALRDGVGAIAAVSSASVYRDARGRTLDEAAVTGFPAMPDRIDEAQPTVEPGDATYSTRKVAMERALLDGARVPVTILRPCAIHGPGTTHPREWWFVKRALDGRRRVPLAFDGRSRFHTTAAATIAAICRRAAVAGDTRVLNVGDPDPPDVTAIGTAIGAAMEHDWTMAPFAGAPAGPVGGTPWSVPRPFLLDTRAADSLGEPPAPYAGFLPVLCAALVAAAGGDWRAAFPVSARYPHPPFDYAAEDAFLAGR